MYCLYRFMLVVVVDDCVVVSAWEFCLELFFFKQKTAYEMRISDWSSDVCSSDLGEAQRHRPLLVQADDVERMLGNAREPVRVDHRAAPARQDRKSTRLKSSH